ncbi:unnamed protein product [Cylicocyclus nassatus]|uniref:Uncharacterized protein n=1 Tax=Cylicocyclus nassatus TaxID=53992 RepID=A0AA36M6K8_CYLNA|nr:unnamed protein product [Cylicocyclus nassatus]
MQIIQEKFWIVLRLQFYVIYLLLQHSYQKIKDVFGVAAGIADIPDGHVRMFSYYLALRDIGNYKFDHEKQCFIINNRKASGGVINRRTPSEDIPGDENMPPEED